MTVCDPDPAIEAGSETLTTFANRVLMSPSAAAKTEASFAAVDAWRDGKICELGNQMPPSRPIRPDRPVLRAPREMPSRGRAGSHNNRIALNHAIAHIEFNAIDLAWDIVSRFVNDGLPQQFYTDWIEVAADETRHFNSLQNRLAELGSGYGDLPAHDGLWEAAEKTRHDLLARLAVVPLVLEARGLDVAPAMISRLRSVGDMDTANILANSYEDEIRHVAIGHRWFKFECDRREIVPEAAFHEQARLYGMGALKAPFNEPARDSAGLPRNYYLPLTSV